ncbi:hypothetical protein M427DRAFT_69677 [Gonapodya prolifera JEL478]|uniref:PB1 domain-containing protein n=1 Tax=Gonapodya prolifera (strain JEL478) TaxID=1344416 RepID=A0A139AGS6_GONPJ|nr:hypothetical protein M427DRAFT_69677 [Gonapodya prolifera JEL478]|eukprot:KXS16006.1 hypothetical protein M427DRAFT_69677 [Gonapodya prolifera JEL478]
MAETVFQVSYQLAGSQKAKMVSFPGEPTKLDELKEAIKKKIPEVGNNFTLEYKAQNGAAVSLDDDSDLRLCLTTALRDQNPKLITVKSDSGVPVDDDKPPPRHAAPAATGGDVEMSGPPPRMPGRAGPRPDQTEASGPPPRLVRSTGGSTGNTDVSGPPPRLGARNIHGDTESSGPPPRVGRR